ncbi:hypothetical protein BV25DRAFT_627959 [Artomyces pyxidatus]|uniref:Uncharacterized protein n=1 Tax=Artomyces pyxidatus TaxID=48021 RepID=A0ACB8T2T0_9AGAM|nr:hypothetical protein BV25DRAFT_627959 [Artomyces pyxidatus]
MPCGSEQCTFAVRQLTPHSWMTSLPRGNCLPERPAKNCPTLLCNAFVFFYHGLNFPVADGAHSILLMLLLQDNYHRLWAPVSTGSLTSLTGLPQAPVDSFPYLAPKTSLLPAKRHLPVSYNLSGATVHCVDASRPQHLSSFECILRLAIAQHARLSSGGHVWQRVCITSVIAAPRCNGVLSEFISTFSHCAFHQETGSLLSALFLNMRPRKSSYH